MFRHKAERAAAVVIPRPQDELLEETKPTFKMLFFCMFLYLSCETIIIAINAAIFSEIFLKIAQQCDAREGHWRTQKHTEILVRL